MTLKLIITEENKDNKMNHLTKTRPTGILDKHKFCYKVSTQPGR